MNKSTVSSLVILTEIMSHDLLLALHLKSYIMTRGVNRLSIIRNSIEKTDYRLWIDTVENYRDDMAISHTNLFEHKKNIHQLFTR